MNKNPKYRLRKCRGKLVSVLFAFMICSTVMVASSFADEIEDQDSPTVPKISEDTSNDSNNAVENDIDELKSEDADITKATVADDNITPTLDENADIDEANNETNNFYDLKVPDKPIKLENQDNLTDNDKNLIKDIIKNQNNLNDGDYDIIFEGNNVKVNVKGFESIDLNVLDIISGNEDDVKLDDTPPMELLPENTEKMVDRFEDFKLKDKIVLPYGFTYGMYNSEINSDKYLHFTTFGDSAIKLPNEILYTENPNYDSNFVETEGHWEGDGMSSVWVEGAKNPNPQYVNEIMGYHFFDNKFKKDKYKFEILSKYNNTDTDQEILIRVTDVETNESKEFKSNLKIKTAADSYGGFEWRKDDSTISFFDKNDGLFMEKYGDGLLVDILNSKVMVGDLLNHKNIDINNTPIHQSEKSVIKDFYISKDKFPINIKANDIANYHFVITYVDGSVIEQDIPVKFTHNHIKINGSAIGYILTKDDVKDIDKILGESERRFALNNSKLQSNTSLVVHDENKLVDESGIYNLFDFLNDKESLFSVMITHDGEYEGGSSIFKFDEDSLAKAISTKFKIKEDDLHRLKDFETTNDKFNIFDKASLIYKKDGKYYKYDKNLTKKIMYAWLDKTYTNDTYEDIEARDDYMLGSTGGPDYKNNELFLEYKKAERKVDEIVIDMLVNGYFTFSPELIQASLDANIKWTTATNANQVLRQQGLGNKTPWMQGLFAQVLFAISQQRTFASIIPYVYTEAEPTEVFGGVDVAYKSAKEGENLMDIKDLETIINMQTLAGKRYNSKDFKPSEINFNGRVYKILEKNEVLVGSDLEEDRTEGGKMKHITYLYTYDDPTPSEPDKPTPPTPPVVPEDPKPIVPPTPNPPAPNVEIPVVPITPDNDKPKDPEPPVPPVVKEDKPIDVGKNNNNNDYKDKNKQSWDRKIERIEYKNSQEKLPQMGSSQSRILNAFTNALALGLSFIVAGLLKSDEE